MRRLETAEGKYECRNCGPLPISEFHKDPGYASGLRRICKTCVRRKDKKRNRTRWKTRDRRLMKKYDFKYQLRKRYGLTVEEYAALERKQKGLCAICNKLPAKPCLDHDHQTGKIRGVLCYACNQGLGLFRDDLEVLRRAIAYLRKHRSS